MQRYGINIYRERNSKLHLRIKKKFPWKRPQLKLARKTNFSLFVNPIPPHIHCTNIYIYVCVCVCLCVCMCVCLFKNLQTVH